MTIKNNQINEIETLLIEGEIALSSLPIGQKKFIDKVKEIIKKFCRENNEQIPDWVDYTIPYVSVSNEERTEQEIASYYIKLLPHFINVLRKLQFDYYNRMQLEESKKQTTEAFKQTQEARNQTFEAQRANKWAKKAFIISVFAIAVSIVAICTSMQIRTIQFNNDQFQEIKDLLVNDSILVSQKN